MQIKQSNLSRIPSQSLPFSHLVCFPSPFPTSHDPPSSPIFETVALNFEVSPTLRDVGERGMYPVQDNSLRCFSLLDHNNNGIQPHNHITRELGGLGFLYCTPLSQVMILVSRVALKDGGPGEPELIMTATHPNKYTSTVWRLGMAVFLLMRISRTCCEFTSPQHNSRIEGTAQFLYHVASNVVPCYMRPLHSLSPLAVWHSNVTRSRYPIQSNPIQSNPIHCQAFLKTPIPACLRFAIGQLCRVLRPRMREIATQLRCHGTGAVSTKYCDSVCTVL